MPGWFSLLVLPEAVVGENYTSIDKKYVLRRPFQWRIQIFSTETLENRKRQKCTRSVRFLVRKEYWNSDMEHFWAAEHFFFNPSTSVAYIYTKIRLIPNDLMLPTWISCFKTVFFWTFDLQLPRRLTESRKNANIVKICLFLSSS